MAMALGLFVFELRTVPFQGCRKKNNTALRITAGR